MGLQPLDNPYLFRQQLPEPDELVGQRREVRDNLLSHLRYLPENFLGCPSNSRIWIIAPQRADLEIRREIPDPGPQQVHRHMGVLVHAAGADIELVDYRNR